MRVELTVDCTNQVNKYINEIEEIVKTKYPMNNKIKDIVNSIFVNKINGSEDSNNRSNGTMLIESLSKINVIKTELLTTIKTFADIIRSEARFIVEDDCEWYCIPLENIFTSESPKIHGNKHWNIRLTDDLIIPNFYVISFKPGFVKIRVVDDSGIKRLKISFRVSDDLFREYPLTLKDYQEIEKGYHEIKSERSNSLIYSRFQYTPDINNIEKPPFNGSYLRLKQLAQKNRELRRHIWFFAIQAKRRYGKYVFENKGYKYLNTERINDVGKNGWFSKYEIGVMWSQACHYINLPNADEYKDLWLEELLIFGGRLNGSILSIPRVGNIVIDPSDYKGYNPFAIRIFYNSNCLEDFRIVITKMHSLDKRIDIKYGVFYLTTHLDLASNQSIPFLRSGNRCGPLIDFVTKHFK